MSANAVIYFLCLHSKKIYVKKFCFLKFKALYVLKTYFDSFNSQVNNLDGNINMEIEQHFYRQTAIFWKN